MWYGMRQTRFEFHTSHHIHDSLHHALLDWYEPRRILDLYLLSASKILKRARYGTAKKSIRTMSRLTSHNRFDSNTTRIHLYQSLLCLFDEQHRIHRREGLGMRIYGLRIHYFSSCLSTLKTDQHRATNNENSVAHRGRIPSHFLSPPTSPNQP
jgi:hypothetical protein